MNDNMEKLFVFWHHNSKKNNVCELLEIMFEHLKCKYVKLENEEHSKLIIVSLFSISTSKELK